DVPPPPRLVAHPGTRGRPGQRLRLPARRGPPPAARPALAPSTPGRARALPCPRPRPVRVGRPSLDRTPPGRRYRLRTPRGHLHRPRHTDRRDRAPSRPGRPRHHPHPTHAAQRLRRHPRMGLRRGPVVGGARTLRRTRRPQGLRRRRPRTGTCGPARRGPQPPGPLRRLPAPLRPLLPRRERLGTLAQPRRARLRPRAPPRPGLRARLAGTPSPGRTTPGRRARTARHTRGPATAPTVRRGRGLGHPPGPAPEPDRRDRPQRPGHRAAPRGRRARHERPVVRRPAPRPARGTDRRDPRV